MSKAEEAAGQFYRALSSEVEMDFLSQNLRYPNRLLSNTWDVISKYRKGRADPCYKFSLDDALLYWHERNWRLPHLFVLQEEEAFYQFRINELNFFWPKSLNFDGIPWLFNEVFHDPTRNPSSYAHNLAAIPQNGWVIDGGACEGFFVFFAYQRRAARVIAVEPLPLLCAALEKTFEEKRVGGVFSVVSAALGKEPRTSALNWNSDHPWNGHLSAGVDGAPSEPVEIVPIDELVEAQRLRGPGFIKLDVEGSEMDALKGAQNTLKTLKPNLAIAVYHKYDNARECAAIIKEAEPTYQTEFRGMYGWFDGPPRPHLLFAW